MNQNYTHFNYRRQNMCLIFDSSHLKDLKNTIYAVSLLNYFKESHES